MKTYLCSDCISITSKRDDDRVIIDFNRKYDEKFPMVIVDGDGKIEVIDIHGNSMKIALQDGELRIGSTRKARSRSKKDPEGI